ncbi:MAG: GCG_CRPN prefix-to-repeats domain-containing protein [Bryobacteraceae bacterium]
MESRKCGPGFHLTPAGGCRAGGPLGWSTCR